MATTRLRGRALKATLARVRTAKAARTAYVANAKASTALTGQPLAATGNPITDAQLTLLCSLLSATT